MGAVPNRWYYIDQATCHIIAFKFQTFMYYCVPQNVRWCCFKGMLYWSGHMSCIYLNAVKIQTPALLLHDQIYMLHDLIFYMLEITVGTSQITPQLVSPFPELMCMSRHGSLYSYDYEYAFNRRDPRSSRSMLSGMVCRRMLPHVRAIYIQCTWHQLILAGYMTSGYY